MMRGGDWVEEQKRRAGGNFPARLLVDFVVERDGCSRRAVARRLGVDVRHLYNTWSGERALGWATRLSVDPHAVWPDFPSVVRSSVLVRWSPLERARAVGLADGGASYVEVERLTGIPRQTVSRWRLAQGAEHRRVVFGRTMRKDGDRLVATPV